MLRGNPLIKRISFLNLGVYFINLGFLQILNLTKVAAVTHVCHQRAPEQVTDISQQKRCSMVARRFFLQT